MAIDPVEAPMTDARDDIREAAEGITIKPLEWRKPTDHPQDSEDAFLVADGIGGRYSISEPTETRLGVVGHLLWDAEDNFSFTEHLTLEAAKAAAQADYESRIRSALDTDAIEAAIRAKQKETGA